MQKVSIQGKFISASTIEVFGKNNTKIRTMLLDMTDNPQYPNIPVLQVVGEERCNMVNLLKANDQIQVEIVIDGRTYQKDGETKYMTNLNVLNIFRTRLESLSTPVNQQPEPEPFDEPF